MGCFDKGRRRISTKGDKERDEDMTYGPVV